MKDRVIEHDCRACLYFGMGCIDLNCDHFVPVDEDAWIDQRIELGRADYMDSWYLYVGYDD